MTTTIRLRGPADIITVLPYHLGYRPRDSLVLVSIGGGRLGFVARLDLPPPDLAPERLVEVTEQVVGQLVPLVVRESPDEVVLVTYESVADQGEAVGVALREALRDAEVRVSDRFVVRDDRFYAPDCSGPCCPAEGEPLPADSDVPAVAQYVLLGRRPAADRRDLADRVRPRGDVGDDERCAAVMRSLVRSRTARTSARSGRTLGRSGRAVRPSSPLRRDAAAGLGQRATARALHAWGQVLGAAFDDDLDGAGRPVPDEAWAWAAVALLDVQVRDLVAAWLCPGSLSLDVFAPQLRRLAADQLPLVDDDTPVECHDRLVEQLAQLCRRTPEPISAGPLTILAQVTWWVGDGAMARTALDLALEVDPTYRLALLLEQLVDHAIRPRAFRGPGMTEMPA